MRGPGMRVAARDAATAAMTPLTAAGLTVDERSLAVILGVVGGAWGLAADRIGARWPAHDDGSVRAVDWRTLVVALAGAAALAALPPRVADAGQVLLFGAYFLALVLLLATDLDQRLLPDLVTLPLIAVTLVAALAGWNPLVAGTSRLRDACRGRDPGLPVRRLDPVRDGRHRDGGPQAAGLRGPADRASHARSRASWSGRSPPGRSSPSSWSCAA